ncbi:MAG TPA: hypothetical protein VJZ25_07405, partial [Gemmatimonadaceae bacterium]|nr:hypothetical protein [Gemmatimonadaceae bacterium]
MLRFVTVALLGLLTIGAGSPAGRIPSLVDSAIQQITAAELHRHVDILASDAFSGRGLGHPGNRQAEQYIARALGDARIPPAAPDYLQRVEVYQPRLGPGARLTISSDQTSIADVRVGSDFYPLPASGDRPVTGRVVFAGHGLSVPEARHDDFASIDVRGAIVLALDDVPDAVRKLGSLSSGERTELASVDRKLADAHARGAVGVVVVQRSMSDSRTVWPETTSIRSASYRLLAPM